MHKNDTRNDLKAVLGRWDSVAIVLAIVIGVGIFRVPAEIARYLQSPPLMLLAWVTGGAISFLGALCYAELSSSFPETGGNYVYLKKSYGPSVAFLFGWSELLVIGTGSIAAVAFICAEHLQSLLALGNHMVKTIAIATVAILAVVNVASLQYGKKTQDIFVVLKIAAVVGLIFLGFISGKGDIAHFYSDLSASKQGTIPLFGLALIPILWTYGGWHENICVAGEIKNPRSTLPFALVTGVCVITGLYVGANILYIYILPVAEIAETELVAARVLKILSGPYGRKILEVIIIVSSIAGINAMLMTGSRVTYAMAKDNQIFRYLGIVSRRFATPSHAITATALWSIVLILWGTFNKLLFFTGILVWLFFALVVAGLFILRRRFPDMQRPYKVWGYPVTPSLFILISIALVINTLISYTTPSLIGLGLLASGIPVYFISRRMQ